MGILSGKVSLWCVLGQLYEDQNTEELITEAPGLLNFK
jgi:hypothetical protein